MDASDLNIIRVELNPGVLGLCRAMSVDIVFKEFGTELGEPGMAEAPRG